MCVFAQKRPQWFKAVCSFFCFFPPFLHMCNHWWWNPRPDATDSNTRSLTHSLTHTHSYLSLTHTLIQHTASTSLHFASSTSPRWLPVFASTWLASGPTGRFQSPLMGNTGGSTWTIRSLLSYSMVRLGHQSLYVATSNSGCDLLLIFFFFFW